MKSEILSFLVVSAVVGYTFCREEPWTICPEPERVSPCKCEKYPNQSNAIFVCSNLTHQEQLDEVLEKSGDFPFRVAIFENSILQYIPHIMFERKQYRRLTIKNCTLSSILDDDIRTNTPLYSLWIEDVHLQRGFLFRNVMTMRNLRSLHIESTEIKKIPDNVSDFLSGRLENIDFVNTKMMKIGDTAFSTFSKLEALVIKKNLLKTVTASMFPKNILQIVLSDNKIRTLPPNFVKDLPNLDSIYLDGNQLTTIEERVFGHNEKFTYISIKDNPIVCDCKFRWLLGRKRPYIQGECSSPTKKNIRDLTEHDLAYC